MAAGCKYFASNGKPSQLFNTLFDYLSPYYGSTRESETKAVELWLAASGVKPGSDFKPAFDGNGEPVVAIQGDQLQLKLDNGGFLSIEDDKLGLLQNTKAWTDQVRDIYRVFDITGDYKSDLTELVSQGLIIRHNKLLGDKLYVRGEVDIENAYFDGSYAKQQELNEMHADQNPISEYLIEDDNSNRILKNILDNSLVPVNREIAARLLVSGKQRIKIMPLSKTEIEAKYPDIKGPVNVYYDIDSNTLVFNKDKTMSVIDFEFVVLNEIMYGSLESSLISDPVFSGEWDALFNQVSAAAKAANVSSEYLKDPHSFARGILRSSIFRNNMDRLAMGAKSVYQVAQAAIMRRFNIMPSRANKLTDFLNQSTSVLNAGRVASFAASPMAGLDTNSLLDAVLTGDGRGVVEDAEESTKEPEKEAPAVKIGNYYTNQLTGDKVFDHFIKAHLEKIRSIQVRRGRRGQASKAESARLRKEQNAYSRYMAEIRDSANHMILVTTGFKELGILERQLENKLNLTELGEGMKLLDAWVAFSEVVEVAVKAGEIPTPDTSSQLSIDKIVGQAKRLHARYLTEMFDTFKTRLESEHLPPDVINGIHVNMTVKDIGMMTAQFIGLSIGSDPLEFIADFMIRISADRTNRDWLGFQDELNGWLKKLGTNDISRLFITKEDGTRQLQMKYSPKLHEELYKRYAEVKGYEHERLPLIRKKRELEREYNKAKLAGDKEASERLREHIREVQKDIETHTAKTKSWNDYMDFMRQNFKMDIMKVHIPAKLEDDTDNTHPDAGTTKLIRWSDMTEQEKTWALQDWNAFREDMKEMFTDYTEDPNGVLDELTYNKELAKYDPEAFIEWYTSGNKELRPQFAGMWFAISPNDNWINSEFYSKLPADWQQFYDWFSEEFIKAHENIPQDENWFGDYERDKLIRNFIYTDEESAEKLKYLAKDVKTFLQDIYSVTKAEQTETLDPSSPLSNKQVKSLRFRNLKDVAYRSQGYFKKGDSLPADIQEGLDKKRYEWNDKNVLVDLKGRAVKNIVPSLYDPIKIFSDFKQMSLGYKYKKDVEDILLTVKDIAESAQVEDKRKFGDKHVVKMESWKGKRIASTINAYMYGEKAKPITAEGLTEGERKLSAAQIIDSLNKFTRARQLGLNLPSGITNLTLGTINNFMFAGRDEFFNEGELKWAYAKLKGSVIKFGTFNKVQTEDAMKVLLLIKRFNLFNNFLEDAFINKESFGELYNQLFFLQKGGEFLNQGALMLAMMKRETVKDADGNPVMKDGKAVSLWDAFSVKDGKLTLDYNQSNYANPDKMAVFGMAVSQQIKEIHGDYDPLNFKMINRNLWGRIIMMFRNWLPMAVETRMGSYRRDNILSMFAGRDIEREGRWRTFAEAMTGGNALDATVGEKALAGAKNFGKFLLGTLGSTWSTSFGKKIMGDFGFSKDYQKMNMALNMKEAWWLMAISTAGVIIKNMIPSGDDDDDEWNRAKMIWLYNQASRVDNDLWFYYNPISFYKVVRDPIPLGSTLMQATKVFQAGRNYLYDPGSDTYQTGMRKGNSKFWTQFQMFWPVIRQKESLWSMWENVYSNNVIR